MRTRISLGSYLLALLASGWNVTGCGKVTLTADCSPGEVLDGGTCVVLCNSYSDCAVGDECRAGACATSACGNGIIGNGEECDLGRCGDGVWRIERGEACDGGEGCATDCQPLAGWNCAGDDCAPTVYRVALVNQTAEQIDLFDLSVRDAPVPGRTIVRGYDPQSPWPEWSPDGNHLLYSAGSGYGLGSVYFYDVTTADSFYTYFEGLQPASAWDTLKVAVSRPPNGFAVWQNSAQVDADLVTTASLSWPRWDPGDELRFAYLDASGALPVLMIHDDSGNWQVATGIESSFAWHPPAGGAVTFLKAGVTGCDISLATLAAGGAKRVSNTKAIVEKVPCTTPVSWAPDGEKLAVIEGADLYVLNYAAGGGVIDFSSESPLANLNGTIVDIGWTPDGDMVAALAHVAGTAGPTKLWLAPPSGTPIDTTISSTYTNLRMSPAYP